MDLEHVATSGPCKKPSMIEEQRGGEKQKHILFVLCPILACFSGNIKQMAPDMDIRAQ